MKSYIKIGTEEIEKVSDTCVETCPYCENEVEIETKFEKQECPKCGSIIKPCNLCLTDKIKCIECPLDK